MNNIHPAILTLLAAAALLSIAACQPPAQPAAVDYGAEYRPAVDTYIDSYNTRDYTGLDMAIAEDYSRAAPDFVASSRDELIDRLRDVHAAYPDFRIVVRDAVFAKDLGFIRWTVNATATAEDGSSGPVEITGATMMRFADGLIAEEWVYYDTAEFERQLGVDSIPHAG